MIVSKFGGTSVQDSKAIKRVFSIVASKKEPVFIVVSALSKVTDSLIKIATKTRESKVEEAKKILNDIIDRHLGIADELGVLDSVNPYFEKTREELVLLIHALVILGELSPRSLDKIMSYGELMSSTLVFEYFRAQKLSIFYVDPRTVIKTNSNFTEAEIDFLQTEAELSLILEQYGNKYRYFITGGFVGSDKDGNTTTLSRGGSDYTASVIASLLGAKRLEIWTDVPGVMTSDPRLVPTAKVISEVSYAEASELAFFGAKVLHPKTIYPAVKKKIPVLVLNSLRPKDEGTIILPTASKKKIVKAIAFRRNIVVITIHSNRMLGAFGFLARVFEIFKKYRTSVDLVSTSEVSISLTIDDIRNLHLILEELKEFATVKYETNQAIISIVGEGLKDTTNVANRIFEVLRNTRIKMISMGASDINFSIVVDENDCEESIKVLHEEFFGKNIFPKLFKEYNYG